MMPGRQHEELLGPPERIIHCELPGRRYRWVEQRARAMHRLLHVPRRGRGVVPCKRLERAEDNRRNDEQLDQRDAPDAARSRASRTQARIRSPKPAMNA